MSRTSFAPGKIILSGEYAVLFGYQGLAVPSSPGVQAVFEEDAVSGGIDIDWKGGEMWQPYLEKIVGLCQKKNPELSGTLRIHTDLPLGKGMGSSTALIVAVTRVLLAEDSRVAALEIEDALNPGHSGLDFAVIWENAPVLFTKGIDPQRIDVSPGLLRGAILVDTGFPGESTTELVAWMRSREHEIKEPLEVIGTCTRRLAQGEPLPLVMREHNKAQTALGVVPPEVRDMIAAIEQIDGAAKVIGAGSRTGGAGMVLALGNPEEILSIAHGNNMSTISL